MKTDKISIIKTDFVGSTSAFAIMSEGLSSDIALVDVNRIVETVLRDEQSILTVSSLFHGGGSRMSKWRCLASSDAAGYNASCPSHWMKKNVKI